MVAFVSAGLGIGHKDFDGYRGRLRPTKVLLCLQGCAEVNEYGFCGRKDRSNALNCLPACKYRLCDNMINKNFEESSDDTADEYEKDSIGDDDA